MEKESITIEIKDDSFYGVGGGISLTLWTDGSITFADKYGESFISLSPKALEVVKIFIDKNGKKK